jgi:predicted Zn-ribbon and HTH transcriptional regulator
MPRSSYVRLSAQDHSFLVAERRSTPMHVGGIQIYEAGSLRKRDGGVDVATFKRGIESVMHLLPRYRQRLRWTPAKARPCGSTTRSSTSTTTSATPPCRARAAARS